MKPKCGYREWLLVNLGNRIPARELPLRVGGFCDQALNSVQHGLVAKSISEILHHPSQQSELTDAIKSPGGSRGEER